MRQKAEEFPQEVGACGAYRKARADGPGAAIEADDAALGNVAGGDHLVINVALPAHGQSLRF